MLKAVPTWHYKFEIQITGFERGMVDLLAKACAHAGMKAIGVKTTMIISATFAVGFFNLKNKKHKQFGCFLPGSLVMYFEKRWNRIAKCLGRLRTWVLGSLAGFPMFAACWHHLYIDSLPTVSGHTFSLVIVCRRTRGLERSINSHFFCAVSYAVREYGSNSNVLFHLDDVFCNGTESMLSECGHRGIGIHNCASNEEAAVICSGKELPTNV